MAEFTERWLGRFRGAQRDLIDACHGIERVADLTNYGKSTVGRWRNPSDRDLMPYPVALMLEADCGRPILTRLMAEFNGRPLGESDARGDAVACLSSQVAELVEQASRMVVETVRAKADGVVTPAEAEMLRGMVASVARINDAIDNTLSHAKVEGGLRSIKGGAA